MLPAAPEVLARFRSLLLIAALAAFLPAAAFAQTYSWVVPVGGETWTAGTSHTIHWTGGPVGSNVTVQIGSIATSSVVATLISNGPNVGYAVWTIPFALPAGQYIVYIEDAARTTWTYGPIVNVQTPPPCTVGCTYVATGLDIQLGYAAVSCGTTLGQAQSLAAASIQSLLTTACSAGSLDLTSVLADYTVVPTGVCPVGQFGPIQVEASAVACCCNGPTSSSRRTWGQLKTHYR